MTRHRYRSVTLILALALFLSLAPTGCSPASQDGPTEPEVTGNTNLGAPRADTYAVDDVFSLNYSHEAGFNPIWAKSGHNLLIIPLMFEPLFEVDENMEAQPVLCTSWKSEDGISWFFDMDPTRQMHDGSTLSASDAYYTILRAQQDTKYRDRLSIIKGISPMSESQLAVTLQYANFQFPALLNIPIMKSGTGDMFAPIGTGPYAMAETEDRLVAFPQHPLYDSLPIDVFYLKEFSRAEDLILAYEDSEIDLVTNDPTGMSNLGYGSANEVRDFPTTNLHYLGFNLEKPTGYRNALTYIINRSYIATDLMGGRGVAVTLPILPTSKYYNAAYARLFEFSAEKFEAALITAGIEDFDDDGFLEYKITGIPVEMNINFIVNNESAVKVAAAREITSRLRQAGITVALRELPFADYLKALEDKDFDMYYAEVKLTADFNLLQLLAKDGALNFGGVGDATYETHIHAYLEAPEESRKFSADFMLRHIVDTAPIIPIAFEKQEVLTHADIVTGIRPTQYNVFHNITSWRIDLASNPYRGRAVESEETGE